MLVQRQTHATTKYMNSVSSEEAVNEAIRLNLAVVLPKKNQIQIDIDDKTSLQLFYHRLSDVKQWFKTTVVRDEISRNKKHGRHITIEFDSDIEPLERIFLQLYLASDRKREWLSFQRYLAGDPNPTLFFERVEDV